MDQNSQSKTGSQSQVSQPKLLAPRSQPIKLVAGSQNFNRGPIVTHALRSSSSNNSAGFARQPSTNKRKSNNQTQEEEEMPAPSRKKRIEIEFLQDRTKRHITFSKRKAGILKKAYELSVLTGSDVLLLIASDSGSIYTFATDKLRPLVTGSRARKRIQECLLSEVPNSLDHEPEYDELNISGESDDQSDGSMSPDLAQHHLNISRKRSEPTPSNQMRIDSPPPLISYNQFQHELRVQHLQAIQQMHPSSVTSSSSSSAPPLPIPSSSSSVPPMPSRTSLPSTTTLSHGPSSSTPPTYKPLVPPPRTNYRPSPAPISSYRGYQPRAQHVSQPVAYNPTGPHQRTSSTRGQPTVPSYKPLLPQTGPTSTSSYRGARPILSSSQYQNRYSVAPPAQSLNFAPSSNSRSGFPPPISSISTSSSSNSTSGSFEPPAPTPFESRDLTEPMNLDLDGCPDIPDLGPLRAPEATSIRSATAQSTSWSWNVPPPSTSISLLPRSSQTNLLSPQTAFENPDGSLTFTPSFSRSDSSFDPGPIPFSMSDLPPPSNILPTSFDSPFDNATDAFPLVADFGVMSALDSHA